MEIEGLHSEVEVIMDRSIGEYHNISIIIEMTIGETILERHKIIEVKTLDVDIEIIIIEMTTLEEVEVGLRKNNNQVILAEIIEVIAGQDQVQEPVLIETELDVLSVGNMIILQKTV